MGILRNILTPSSGGGGGGGLSYQGTWNASTNTPSLSSGVGTQGHYYIVSTAGSTDLDGITDWGVNDWAIYNGSAWQKIDNSDVEAIWGSITGTLSNQTDLNSALADKLDKLSSTTDNSLIKIDGANGDIQETNIIVDDSNNISNINNLSASSLNIDGDSFKSGNGIDTISLQGSNYDVRTENVEEGNDNIAQFVNSRFSNNSNICSRIINLRSRGTKASPAIVQDNDIVNCLISGAYDGSEYRITGLIRSIINDASPAQGDIAADLMFYTSTGTDYEAVARFDKDKITTFFGGVNLDDTSFTASEILALDSSKNIQTLDVATYPSLTELSYVKGVTSAIQDQINDKITTSLSSGQILVGNSSNEAAAVAMSGDVAIDNAGATTIQNNAVKTNMIADSNITLAKVQDIADNTLLANITGGNAAPQAITPAQTRSLLNVANGADNTQTAINDASSKTTPVDADLLALLDSEDSSNLKKLTWANVEATLKTYFDTLYSDSIGKHTFTIMAGSMEVPDTNGAESSTTTSGNGVIYRSLDFDDTTEEYANFNICFPKSWNKGTVTFRVRWTSGSGGASSGTVRWGIQAVAVGDDDSLSATLGSAQTVDDNATAANDLQVSSVSSSLTIGGTPANGDISMFRVYRDVTVGSNMSGDAKLIAIDVFMNTDAATDD